MIAERTAKRPFRCLVTPGARACRPPATSVADPGGFISRRGIHKTVNSTISTSPLSRCRDSRSPGGDCPHPAVREGLGIEPPGEEPGVFVDIEGQQVPTDVLNAQPGPCPVQPGGPVAFDLYQVPRLARRRFADDDAAPDADASCSSDWPSSDLRRQNGPDGPGDVIPAGDVSSRDRGPSGARAACC